MEVRSVNPGRRDAASAERGATERGFEERYFEQVRRRKGMAVDERMGALPSPPVIPDTRLASDVTAQPYALDESSDVLLQTLGREAGSAPVRGLFIAAPRPGTTLAASTAADERITMAPSIQSAGVGPALGVDPGRDDPSRADAPVSAMAASVRDSAGTEGADRTSRGRGQGTALEALAASRQAPATVTVETVVPDPQDGDATGHVRATAALSDDARIPAPDTVQLHGGATHSSTPDTAPLEGGRTSGHEVVLERKMQRVLQQAQATGAAATAERVLQRHAEVLYTFNSWGAQHAVNVTFATRDTTLRGTSQSVVAALSATDMPTDADSRYLIEGAVDREDRGRRGNGQGA